MEALPPKDTWVNADVSMLNVIRLFLRRDLAKFFIRHFGQPDVQIKFNDELDPLNEFVAELMFRNAHLMSLAYLPAFFLPKARGLKRVILDQRNEVGFQGIIQELATHDRVIST